MGEVQLGLAMMLQLRKEGWTLVEALQILPQIGLKHHHSIFSILTLFLTSELISPMTYVLLGEQLNKCMLFLLLLNSPLTSYGVLGPSRTPILSQKTLRGENRGILREYIWKGSLFKPQVAMERESTLGSNQPLLCHFLKKRQKT